VDDTPTQATPEEERPLLEMARMLLLATIGAVALAQEQLEALVNKLVERGEIARRDRQALMRTMKEKRQKQATKAEQELDQRTEAFLKRLNLVTSSDIKDLNAQIAELNAKLDELEKA
jgi:polyhydroxyalkanoate synthesis regulator phasin